MSSCASKVMNLFWMMIEQKARKRRRRGCILQRMLWTQLGIVKNTGGCTAIISPMTNHHHHLLLLPIQIQHCRRVWNPKKCQPIEWPFTVASLETVASPEWHIPVDLVNFSSLTPPFLYKIFFHPRPIYLFICCIIISLVRIKNKRMEVSMF